jgi:hypothetical protein
MLLVARRTLPPVALASRARPASQRRLDLDLGLRRQAGRGRRGSAGFAGGHGRPRSLVGCRVLLGMDLFVLLEVLRSFEGLVTDLTGVERER